jgi:hypothetical protein
VFLIIILGNYEKTPIFAGNRQKSQKIAIITSTSDGFFAQSRPKCRPFLILPKLFSTKKGALAQYLGKNSANLVTLLGSDCVRWPQHELQIPSNPWRTVGKGSAEREKL